MKEINIIILYGLLGEQVFEVVIVDKDKSYFLKIKKKMVNILEKKLEARYGFSRLLINDVAKIY